MSVPVVTTPVFGSERASKLFDRKFESGRSEIYVEPVPGPGGRWKISDTGGEQPRWVRNGREVLYRNGTKVRTIGSRGMSTPGSSDRW